MRTSTFWIMICLILFFMAGCGAGLQSGEPESVSLDPQDFTPTPSKPPPPSSTSTSLPATRTQSPTSAPTPSLTPTSIPEIAPTFGRGEVIFVTNGSREKPWVALTFDVGEQPHDPAGYDLGIEQALIENDAKATFFLGGHWMERNPEIVRRLAANPLFEVGNHSWSHYHFPELSEEEMFQEVLSVNELYYQLTGELMTIFRYPAGDYNDLSLSVLAYTGMPMIQWDVESADPVPDNLADNINRLIRERVQNGSIIVMHANGRGWHTAEALPQMISWLRESGYTLVTVSEMMGWEGNN